MQTRSPEDWNVAGYGGPWEPGRFWHQLNEWFSAYMRLGVFFGVEVRLFYSAAILFPLLALRAASDYSAIPGWGGLSTLALVVGMPVSLLLTIYIHEMGHVAAGWRHRVQSSHINLSPLGGTAHMDSGAPSPGAEIQISFAGPATHLIALCVLYPLSLLLTPAHVPLVVSLLVQIALYTNLALFVFNILPFYPMDGGRIFRAVLAHRMHPNKATLIACYVGMAGSVLLGIYALTSEGWHGGMLLAIALVNFLACRQAMVAAKYEVGPYSDAREPWQQDPDWWKRGGSRGAGSQAEAPRRAAWTPVKEWIARKREPEVEIDEGLSDESFPETARPEQALSDEALDAVLERVAQVGMKGLTAEERRILEVASERARQKRAAARQ